MNRPSWIPVDASGYRVVGQHVAGGSDDATLPVFEADEVAGARKRLLGLVAVVLAVGSDQRSHKSWRSGLKQRFLLVDAAHESAVLDLVLGLCGRLYLVV